MAVSRTGQGIDSGFGSKVHGPKAACRRSGPKLCNRCEDGGAPPWAMCNVHRSAHVGAHSDERDRCSSSAVLTDRHDVDRRPFSPSRGAGVGLYIPLTKCSALYSFVLARVQSSLPLYQQSVHDVVSILRCTSINFNHSIMCVGVITVFSSSPW